MAKKKRSKTPVILRRLFRKRARTLSDIIIALLPSPPPPFPAECPCKGQRCLGCFRGDEDISFLLRLPDPPEYQLEIFRKTIKIVISEQPATTNLLCGGYNDELNKHVWEFGRSEICGQVVMSIEQAGNIHSLGIPH